MSEIVYKVKGESEPVKEIWESYNGDLYIITRKDGDDVFCYARLSKSPQFAEWGWNKLSYLKNAYGRGMLWKVPERKWMNVNSYEKGLLEKSKKEVIKV